MKRQDVEIEVYYGQVLNRIYDPIDLFFSFYSEDIPRIEKMLNFSFNIVSNLKK